ncbi:MAG: (2Fe-2S)-binding protein [bacterium]
MSIKISFLLNGSIVTKSIEQNKRLLDFLRDDFSLSSLKEGCGVGECGVCTVLVNNLAVNSCLMLAPQVEGAEIYTVEGLNHNPEFNKLQKNFLELGAVQCGFCTPGMLISAYALFLKNKNASIEEIKEAISGNLCRCTGYKPIIKAINTTFNGE